MVCPSLSVAISNLETPPLSDNIETVFAFGGSSVYSVSPRNLAKEINRHVAAFLVLSHVLACNRLIYWLLVKGSYN